MVTEEQKPQELSLYDHAAQEMAKLEEGLTDLETRFKGVVFDVTTTKGMDEARKARQEIRQPRYDVQNIAKAKKSELAAISKKIGERAEQVISRIEAIEEPIDKQIKAEEERKAAEKAERERQEAEARQKQVQRVLALRGIPQTMIGATVEELDAATVALMDDDLADVDEVYRPDAVQAREKSIEDLQVMRAQRAEQDAKDAELAELRERAAAQDRELAEQRQREAEERAERDREEQDRRQRDRKATDIINGIRNLGIGLAGLTAADIAARIGMAEQAGQRAEWTAERAGEGVLAVEQTLAALRQAHAYAEYGEARAAREREEAEERARIAQEAEAAELARQQAEELERAQAALAVQEQAIREATLVTAAGAALEFMEREGFGQTVEAAMLRSALAK